MKPYSKNNQTKGISGRRKSKASTHRKRCLRTDKRAMRQESKRIANMAELVDALA